MNAWIGNETLYKFMQFEHLKTLTIVNNDGMTLDFDEGILPLLQICGPQLDNLILNKFPTVNLIRECQCVHFCMKIHVKFLGGKLHMS